MTARVAAADGTATLAPSRDARLVPYCMIALGGLAAAMIAGRPGLAALAVPFALALALGLRRTSGVAVTARFMLDAEQVLEGDVVTGRLVLSWDDGFVAQVMLHRLHGVEPLPGERLAWTLPAGRSASLPVRLRATHWGLHTPAEVWLRLEAPFGLLKWTGRVVAAPSLRVLPGSERLSRLLDPAEARAVLGVHRSRRLGAGSEFAELRAYTPGDRLRDLNWAATARRGRPFVSRRHPELAGDVVIVIDAFADGSTASAEALARAARAAWAIATVHLRANDRVGLAGIGGSTRWLAPAGGRLAKYQLMETLLRIGGEAADPLARGGPETARVPASALVIVLTPLQRAATLDTLKAWRARGRAVAAVVVEVEAPAGEASAAEALARRLWRIELAQRRRELTGVGIPVVTAAGAGPMTPVVAALRRARRGTYMRRGR